LSVESLPPEITVPVMKRRLRGMVLKLSDQVEVALDTAEGSLG
jgi:hypothetical protein